MAERKAFHMNKTLTQRQQAYARLLLQEGLNVQKGQLLAIDCPVDQAWFARLCAAAAYDMGCREVVMNWNDDALTREKYLRAANEVFDSVHSWTADFFEKVSAEGGAWLAIHAADPENLKGCDPDRIQRAQIASGKALEGFRRRETNNEFPWCVCSVPTERWARKVFPELETKAAMERLWEAILQAAYVDDGDAIANWRAHSAELARRTERLNVCAFRMLHYENSLGTDLMVELPEGHFWAGGAETCVTSGVRFSANIPTEEVFTLPVKTGVNGVVYASRPLSLQGNLIEGFGFELKEGKIVRAFAEKGEAVLQNAIAVDEGASYLGEVALVPWDSPISQSGVLFYNTLFDENASCHFAFGEAYPCIRGAEQMSRAELEARGMNTSINHVDFMVGTQDLRITGTTAAGETMTVFENGNFVL